MILWQRNFCFYHLRFLVRLDINLNNNMNKHINVNSYNRKFKSPPTLYRKKKMNKKLYFVIALYCYYFCFIYNAINFDKCSK